MAAIYYTLTIYPYPLINLKVKVSDASVYMEVIDNGTNYTAELGDGQLYIISADGYKSQTIPAVGNQTITLISNTPDISKLSNGTDTYIIRDDVAREAISNLATVATSGSYNDLSNKPTIPTVNNATLTIQKNGTNVATFTANASSNVTANISVPNVTSTYTATGTDAVNGVAVSNAIATKQDTLVSGTSIKTVNNQSLLGSGNISTSTPIDNATITENSSNQIQATCILNKKNNTVLPIWEGTEYEWEHGEITHWYCWQTQAIAGFTSCSNPDGSDYLKGIAYGNGTYVIQNSNKCKLYYSTDEGNSWSTSSTTFSSGQDNNTLAYGNDVFVVYCDYKFWYSEDNGETWSEATSYPAYANLGNVRKVVYGNGVFVAIANYSSNDQNKYTSIYSYDGKTWINGNLPTTLLNLQDICYDQIDKKFYITKSDIYTASNNLVYYSSDGINWTQCQTYVPFRVYRICANNGRIIVSSDNNYVNKVYVSDDCGITWVQKTLTKTTRWGGLSYNSGLNTYLITSSYGTNYANYSIDNGNTWLDCTLPVNGYYSEIASGDNEFLTINGNPIGVVKFSIDKDTVYTLEENTEVTTSSILYTSPEIESQYTIQTASSSNLVLSNNNTYYYDSNATQNTYRTIGTTHPEYLCFIENVGIKIGNTFIATNNFNF